MAAMEYRQGRLLLLIRIDQKTPEGERFAEGIRLIVTTEPLGRGHHGIDVRKR